jgi:hypothetical protein
MDKIPNPGIIQGWSSCNILGSGVSAYLMQVLVLSHPLGWNVDCDNLVVDWKILIQKRVNQCIHSDL